MCILYLLYNLHCIEPLLVVTYNVIGATCVNQNHLKPPKRTIQAKVGMNSLYSYCYDERGIKRGIKRGREGCCASILVFVLDLHPQLIF